MTIGIDFDGVLHRYSRGWQGGRIYDPPVEGAAKAVKTVLELEPAFVFTARRDLGSVVQWIKTHLDVEAIADSPITAREFWEEDGRLLVTNRKYPARAYLDDRAVLFKPGTKDGYGWTQALQDLEIEIGHPVKKTYLVTVKVPKNPEHNPRQKQFGPCPVNGEPCSDVTGEHHTILVRSSGDLSRVKRRMTEKYGHVTRVEAVPFNIPF